MTLPKMGSRTVLIALYVLATVLLVHCDDPRKQRPMNQPPSASGRSTLRYKRMYVMCPPKFSRIGNECYYISPNKLNWLDAYFECKDHNSKLAEPMKYEDKHLRRYLQKIEHRDDLWIGGTYNWKSNKWQWGHNGREMEYQSFSQMVPGSSRDLKFNCALLRAEQKFRWSAEECTKKINFICQHRMPLVSEMSRNQVYSRWNETFPNQKANEKMVYIVNDPNNRTRSDPGRVRIYSSMKQVFRSNPSIQPRPAHRRNPNRAKKHPTPATNNRSEYSTSDAVYRNNQQIAQYAPESQNEINSIDNGHQHRNGHSTPRFNIDFGPRYAKNRDPSLPRNSYRAGQVHLPAVHQTHHHQHQHRHQSGMNNGPSRKTTKRVPHTLPTHPFYTALRTTPTTSTTTTTTTTPAPVTTTRRPTTTTEEENVPFTTDLPEAMTTYQPPVIEPKRIHAMTAEEKKIQRDMMRARLRRLSPEDQQIFLQERARRKRLKEQLLRKLQQQQDNEVVAD